MLVLIEEKILASGYLRLSMFVEYQCFLVKALATNLYTLENAILTSFTKNDAHEY